MAGLQDAAVFRGIDSFWTGGGEAWDGLQVATKLEGMKFNRERGRDGHTPGSQGSV